MCSQQVMQHGFTLICSFDSLFLFLQKTPSLPLPLPLRFRKYYFSESASRLVLFIVLHSSWIVIFLSFLDFLQSIIQSHSQTFWVQPLFSPGFLPFSPSVQSLYFVHKYFYGSHWQTLATDRQTDRHFENLLSSQKSIKSEYIIIVRVPKFLI